jgi:ferritin-like metal-binding protein YciE
MSEEKVADAKLAQYLNEAYAKERELETALQAHIQATTRAPYKKRLQQHLRETKDHGRQVERRIKAITGGGPGAVEKIAGQAIGQAKSLAKGPLHFVRGTGTSEKMLKNAKTEYWNEHEEIATYTAIETLAEEVGDTETAKVARARRDPRLGAAHERRAPPRPRLTALDGALARLERNFPPLRRPLAKLSDRRVSLRGPFGGLEQLVAVVGMGDRGQRLAALVDGQPLQLGGAVLGDDHVDLVARGGDHRAGVEPGHDPRLALAADGRGRRHAEQRAVLERERRAGHEVLVAADA